MAHAFVVENLGKRFRHEDADRPRTFHQFVEGGWRKRRGKHDFWALRNVSFTVEAGEMLGVIGTNGSGKSTLLRILGGVMRPDEGTVVASDRVHGLLDLGAGMHPDLTGRENAICSGVLAGLSRREITARLDDVIEFAELEGFIDEPIRSYSAGMRLRLGFAVAAQTRPRILLIDEVLAVGDLSFQRKCLDRIAKFRAEGCAIVLISHDLAQVESTCDRALWLRKGEIVSLGATHNVAREYESALLSETAARTPDADDFDDPDQPQLKLNENRFGSLENRITRVRLLDADGQEIQSLKAGESLSVQLWIESVVPMTDLHLSITLANEQEVDLIDLNTEREGIELPNKTGTAMIQLSWQRLDLAAGVYHVTLGLYEKSWAYAYDRHVHAYDLRIEGSESSCSLDPPHRWSAHVDDVLPAGKPA